MPDRGLLIPADLPSGPIVAHADGASWMLRGVLLAQVTFEVAREAALAHMPDDVSRPVPCYARLIVLEATDGPLGPLRLAALHVGGRHQLMPRNVLVDGLVSGPAADVAANLGSQFREGGIWLERDDSQLSIQVVDEEYALVQADLPALKAIDPSMLRWDPWLGRADFDGAARLIEYSIRPRATEAFLSKRASVVVDAALPRAHTWRQLRNLNTVSSCFLEGEVEVVLPRVVQPAMPAPP